MSPTAASPALAAPAPGLQKVLLAALAGGVIAGTIDIFAASLITKLPPTTILRAIASGAWGPWAFKAPDWMMAAGFVLQEAMSIVIAGVYALAALRLPSLLKRPIAWGLAYGVGIFVVMNYVVVPLSAAGGGGKAFKPHALHWYTDNGAAMLVFGLIVALVTAWAFRRR